MRLRPWVFYHPSRHIDNERARGIVRLEFVQTLIDVVRFYNKGGEGNSHLDPELKPLNFSDKEMNELVEFMRALTSEDVLKLAQTTKPQSRTPVLVPRPR